MKLFADDFNTFGYENKRSKFNGENILDTILCFLDESWFILHKPIVLKHSKYGLLHTVFFFPLGAYALKRVQTFLYTYINICELIFLFILVFGLEHKKF